MQEVFDFISKCETYYLATVEADQPRVRPFGTIDVFEGKLYIFTGKSKPVSKQMKANPSVEICAYDGKQWLRLQATAAEDDRIEARLHMFARYPFLEQSYKADDGEAQVFCLNNVVASFCTFGGEPRIIKL